MGRCFYCSSEAHFGYAFATHAPIREETAAFLLPLRKGYRGFLGDGLYFLRSPEVKTDDINDTSPTSFALK